MLSLHLVFVTGQAKDHQPRPYLLLFRPERGAGQAYFRFTCTAGSIRLGKRTIGQCLVAATFAAIKRNLLFFDQAARA